MPRCQRLGPPQYSSHRAALDAQYCSRLLVWLPGEMDITNYGQVPGMLVLDGDIDEGTYFAPIEALNSIP